MIARTLQIADVNVRNSYSRTALFCLPKINCRPDGTGIFTDDSWNCNRCRGMEPKAYMPWVQGDKFMFQTNFADQHHADIENPSDPFAPTAAVSAATSYRAELCYPGGSSLVLAEFASASMVAWNGENSYQIVEVDTDLTLFDTLDCWELKISSLDASGNVADFMSTQTFKKAVCTEETILIRGNYKLWDCFGNYYGEPTVYVGDQLLYDNRLRMWGLVANIGISSNASFDFSSANSGQSSVVYRYNTTEWYPPYQRKLLQVFLDSTSFTLGGQYYRRPAYNVEGGFFKIPLEKSCIVTNIC